MADMLTGKKINYSSKEYFRFALILIMVEELSWSDKWECSRVVVCGWCMFSRWIKNQTIPSQLKKYTKAVLNYMVTHKTYFPEYESVQ